MYYKVKFEKPNEKGDIKNYNVLIEAVDVREAIDIAEGELGAEEVVDVRRTNIREVYKSFEEPDRPYMILKLYDSFVNDKGKEKKIPYSILIQPVSMETAVNEAKAINEQGYDLQIEGVNEYKVDVFLRE